MIIRKDDLEAAVEHGVVSASAAKALSEFAIKRAKTPRAVNEHFRLFSNFSEVFICLGLAIVFFATKAMIGIFGTQFTAFAAIAFWLAAEYFTHKTTKMAPALLSVIFSAIYAVTAFLYFAKTTPAGAAQIGENEQGFALTAFALIMIVAFIRFRIPAILAILLPATAGAILSFMGVVSLENPKFLWPIGLCGGLAIGLAIWFDAKDPLRRSRQNAYAFWLFVVGSPMAIHPLFASIWLQADRSEADLIVPVIFGLALVITLIGLILDRRSLVASSLIYFTISLGYFNQNLVGNFATTLALTSLIVGCFVVVLGVLWYRLRAVLLRILPLGNFAKKLPPAA